MNIYCMRPLLVPDGLLTQLNQEAISANCARLLSQPDVRPHLPSHNRTERKMCIAKCTTRQCKAYTTNFSLRALKTAWHSRWNCYQLNSVNPKSRLSPTHSFCYSTLGILENTPSHSNKTTSYASLVAPSCWVPQLPVHVRRKSPGHPEIFNSQPSGSVIGGPGISWSRPVLTPTILRREFIFCPCDGFGYKSLILGGSSASFVLSGLSPEIVYFYSPEDVQRLGPEMKADWYIKGAR